MTVSIAESLPHTTHAEGHARTHAAAPHPPHTHPKLTQNSPDTTQLARTNTAPDAWGSAVGGAWG